MLLGRKKIDLPTREQALPGREAQMPVRGVHTVLGNSTVGPFEGLSSVYFGMGCFWGAERKFWQTAGVYTTAVGYQAGVTPNPTYEEVCIGRTGHNEVVLVVFDEGQVSLEEIFAVFWQGHDPTQGMRQGNDVGTQYRSGIYTTSDAQLAAAEHSRDVFQKVISEAGGGEITSEILAAPPFYYAEDYHQQYLDKNPNGYCGLGGTGLCYPVDASAPQASERHSKKRWLLDK
ncbi:MAG: peptide-methionine (S)-S-oxide reductase MsrA [Myxococcota bacterium]|jgi:peptide-methionine (S)-S-oxide reductase|nr:peptide-methionine (S)-S-oxide reductase MsrA [Myxococcota bacterium]